MKQTEERHSESRMREIRKSGSMRGSAGAAQPPVAPYSTQICVEDVGVCPSSG
jgi:hypothetical protein